MNSRFMSSIDYNGSSELYINDLLSTVRKRKCTTFDRFDSTRTVVERRREVVPLVSFGSLFVSMCGGFLVFVSLFRVVPALAGIVVRRVDIAQSMLYLTLSNVTVLGFNGISSIGRVVYREYELLSRMVAEYRDFLSVSASVREDLFCDTWHVSSLQFDELLSCAVNGVPRLRFSHDDASFLDMVLTLGVRPFYRIIDLDSRREYCGPLTLELFRFYPLAFFSSTALPLRIYDTTRVVFCGMGTVDAVSITGIFRAGMNVTQLVLPSNCLFYEYFGRCLALTVLLRECRDVSYFSDEPLFYGLDVFKNFDGFSFRSETIFEFDEFFEFDCDYVSVLSGMDMCDICGFLREKGYLSYFGEPMLALPYYGENIVLGDPMT